MKYGCRNSCFSLFVNQPSGPKSDGTIRIIVFVFINCINSGGRGMNGRIGLFVMFELSNTIHLMMTVIIINKYYDSFYLYSFVIKIAVFMFVFSLSIACMLKCLNCCFSKNIVLLLPQPLHSQLPLLLLQPLQLQFLHLQQLQQPSRHSCPVFFLQVMGHQQLKYFGDK